jgi:type VI secretion system secreted protein Hcp
MRRGFALEFPCNTIFVALTVPPSQFSHGGESMGTRGKARLLAAGLAVVVCLVSTSSPAAGVDYFLEIAGVEGESQSDRSTQLEIYSFSWGVTNVGTGTGSGGGASRPDVSDLQVRTLLNNASPKLMEACATGKHLPKATLTCRKAGGTQEVFYEVKLEDVLISSYSVAGTSGSDGVPTEEMSLNFTKIEAKYFPMDRSGKTQPPIEGGFDLGQNQ